MHIELMFKQKQGMLISIFSSLLTVLANNKDKDNGNIETFEKCLVVAVRALHFYAVSVLKQDWN